MYLPKTEFYGHFPSVWLVLKKNRGFAAIKWHHERRENAFKFQPDCSSVKRYRVTMDGKYRKRTNFGN